MRAVVVLKSKEVVEEVTELVVIPLLVQVPTAALIGIVIVVMLEEIMR